MHTTSIYKQYTLHHHPTRTENAHSECVIMLEFTYTGSAFIKYLSLKYSVCNGCSLWNIIWELLSLIGSVVMPVYFLVKVYSHIRHFKYFFDDLATNGSLEVGPHVHNVYSYSAKFNRNCKLVQMSTIFVDYRCGIKVRFYLR